VTWIHVYLWVLECEIIKPLTILSFEVAKFINLIPLMLLVN